MEHYPRNFNKNLERVLRENMEWTDSNSIQIETEGIAKIYASGIKACRIGSIRNSLRLADLCFELAQSSRKDSDFTLAFHLLGKGKILSKSYEKANENLVKAIEFAQKSKFELLIPYIYSDLAELQVHLKKPGEGLDILKKVEYSKEINQSFPLKMAFNECRSNAFIMLGEKDSAVKIANENLTFISKTKNINHLIQAKNHLCSIFLAVGNLHKAENINHEVLKSFDVIQDPSEKEKACSLGIQMAKLRKDLPEILALQDKLILLKDQRNIEENSGEHETFYQSVHWGLIENERSQLTEASNRNRFWFVIGGLIIVFVTVSLFISYRLSRKMKLANLKLIAKNREIQRKNLEIEKKSEELNRLNRVLEGKIQERTQKLIQQNNKLREVAYYNSHRVRGPLSTIMGLVDLYQGKMMDDVQLLMDEIDNHSRELDRNLIEINEVLKKEDVSSN